MENLLTPEQRWIFINLTSLLALLGGLTFWAAWLLLALIARRLENAFHRSTYWQIDLAAPFGLVGYIFFQASSAVKHQNLGSLELWSSYILLTFSALACSLGAFRFWRVLQLISREKHVHD